MGRVDDLRTQMYHAVATHKLDNNYSHDAVNSTLPSELRGKIADHVEGICMAISEYAPGEGQEDADMYINGLLTSMGMVITLFLSQVEGLKAKVEQFMAVRLALDEIALSYISSDCGDGGANGNDR